MSESVLEYVCVVANRMYKTIIDKFERVEKVNSQSTYFFKKSRVER